MKKPFGIAGLIYLILSAILLPYLGNFADNPDTFQYISIAKKYMQLDWSHAVNGYWSPLISWLLVIPIAVFNDSVDAFKMLQIAIGLFTLFQWSRIISKSELTKVMQFILAIISVPFLISYALLNCTPDLLFVGMTLWLINILLSGNLTTEPEVALKSAVAGSLMYFTKAFGLPLFIALTIVVILFERKKEKTNFRTVLLMYSVFATLCIIWILNISRSGELTISKAITFNRSLNSDVLQGTETLPVLGSGIIKPENGHTSAWEAPGEYVSKNQPNNFFETFRRNILSIYYFDFRRQIGIIFLLLMGMYFYRKRKEPLKDKWLILMFTTMLLFYGGYSLILVHARYLWINTFIMLAISALFIQQLINNMYLKTTICLCLFLLAMKRPLKEIFFIYDKDYPASQIATAFLHPFKTLNDTYQADEDIRNSIKAFHKIKLPKTNFASLKPARYSRDTYATSLRITESLQSVYYGEIKMPANDINQILRENHISYLIAYEEIPSMTMLFYQKESGIRIFTLKN